MFEAYKTTVDFKIVYIRDSHPTRGFRAPTNDRRGISADKEPRSVADREQWACEDRQKMTCTIPIVMDTFDDATLNAYNAFPQRIFVITKKGKIAYASSGLVGFKQAEVIKTLKRLVPKTDAAK